MIPLPNPLILVVWGLALCASFIPMIAYLVGALTCARHRRLSSKLTLACWGFAGLFLASAIGRFSSYFAFQTSILPMIYYWVMGVIPVVSSILMVYGLSKAFAEISGRLAASKGPIDDLG